MSSDTDLKLADLLKYTSAETAAGTELMYRRTKALADYESANKSLDRARLKPIPQDKSQTVSKRPSFLTSEPAFCTTEQLFTVLNATMHRNIRKYVLYNLA